MRRLVTSLALVSGLGACGGAALPAAEAPSPPAVRADGRPVRLDTAARTLTYGGRTVQAGLGPTSLTVGNGRVYVTDRVQDALLVFRLRPRLALQRRVRVADGPFRVVRRGERLEVTTAHGVVELTADGAAKVLRRRTR